MFIRRRGYSVYLLHTHYSTTTNQVWQNRGCAVTEQFLLCVFFFLVIVYINCSYIWFRRWLKDGKELTDHQKYVILNDARSGILCLTVISATEADIGQYECEV